MNTKVSVAPAGKVIVCTNVWPLPEQGALQSSTPVSPHWTANPSVFRGVPLMVSLNVIVTWRVVCARAGDATTARAAMTKLQPAIKPRTRFTVASPSAGRLEGRFEVGVHRTTCGRFRSAATAGNGCAPDVMRLERRAASWRGRPTEVLATPGPFRCRTAAHPSRPSRHLEGVTYGVKMGRQRAFQRHNEAIR